ncbi:MAG: FAD:protein FMN transferase [Candidatus Pacebacteria bacterium]|nr:FAD:protein FMN transferase [Candidatus Paceibacterota bacterium]
MKETRHSMGMPATVEIVDVSVKQESLDTAFDFFTSVDERFSTYKPDSEISRINRGELTQADYSREMREIFALAEETKRQTNGYFDIATPNGSIDPSGIVKGWAIQKAADILRSSGYENFYVEIAGDIQTAGKNSDAQEWRIGIRNPLAHDEIVKVVCPQGRGIATSGTAARGAHIYDPIAKKPVETTVASLTVIGPNVYEADRFATAAFAMGEQGISFIGSLEGFEGYQIDQSGTAVKTLGFTHYEYESDR